MEALAVVTPDGRVGAFGFSRARLARVVVCHVVLSTVAASACLMGALFLSVSELKAVSALGIFPDVEVCFEGASAVEEEERL